VIEVTALSNGESQERQPFLQNLDENPLLIPFPGANALR
jgi:hypothetical protein